MAITNETTTGNDNLDGENSQKAKTGGEKVKEVALNNVGSAIRTIAGVYRTIQVGNNIPPMLMPLTDNRGNVNKPGFTPNDAYNLVFATLPTFGLITSWYGNLLDSHIDSKENKRFLRDYKGLSTDDKFKRNRNTLLRFDDFTLDYFKHQFYIDGLTPILTKKNLRYANDGSINNSRLTSYKGTTFENEDPVYYGFEVIIDSITSPLLNGSVEHFISNFERINEVQSRKQVIYDFKKQFEKIFKTNATVYYDDFPEIEDKPVSLISKTDRDYKSTSREQSKLNFIERNKKAYLGHYLQKITGINLLNAEKNTGEKLSQFVNYPNDKLTLTFYEDVSGTLSSLAHLYKLLYWSVPNGKNIIPENLLRFNCIIIVSEVRNFKRAVRKTDKSDAPVLEVVKDNVSKYIFSLKECQFFFDKLPIDDSIDMSTIKMFGDGGPGYDVEMNFKYSTVRYEKWIPGDDGYGKYAGYNNGALWRSGNKGSTGLDYLPVPKFYTTNTNTTNNNSVLNPYVISKYNLSSIVYDEETEKPETQNGIVGALQNDKKNESTNEEGESKDNDKKKKSKSNDDDDDISLLGQLYKSSESVGLGFLRNEVGSILSNLNQVIANQRSKILQKFSKNYEWKELPNAIGENKAFVYSGPKYSKPDKTITSTITNSFKSGSNIKDEVKEYFFNGESYLLNDKDQNSKTTNDIANQNSQVVKEQFGTTFDPVSLKDKTYNKSAVEHGLAMLSYQLGIGLNDPQKYPNPIKSVSNINDLVKNNSKVMEESNSNFDPNSLKDKTFNKSAVEHGLAMLSYQFPNPAQKYPDPVNKSILDLNDLVKSKSESMKESNSTFDPKSLKDKTFNKSAVEHGLAMLSLQSPNSAQRYPDPVNKSTSNINDTVKNNSEATKESNSTFNPLSLKDKTFNKSAVEHGLAMLSYQFPNPAQKYPSPINQSILNLNDVVKNNSEIIKESKSTSDSNSLKDKTINSSTVENGLKMLSYQFPNPAQKYPSPINQSILNLNDVVKNNSEAIKNSDSTFDSKSLKDLTYNKSAVENGLSMLSQQFPNSAQKYPAPIEKPISRTLNDIIKSNSIYNDITKVKFGKEQK